MFTLSRKLLFITIFCLTLTLSCFAADAETMYHTEYCFTEADFCIGDMGSADGIFVTAVPDSAIATVKLGNRIIRAGDVLSSEVLQTLRLIPNCTENCTAAFSFLPIFGKTLADPATLTVKIQTGKNEAPKASNVEFETYKNIANDGALNAVDPEGGTLTYQITEAPKRGKVSISDDGTFVYTPGKNKVGEDRFSYTATDDAGNVSKPATVNIRILNPSEKMTFEDMSEDLNQFEAMWLKEKGLYGGKQIGTKLCFNPTENVSRGEFVVMAMQLLDISVTDNETITVFSDQNAAPQWMQPYLTAAFRNGYIRGEKSEDGLIFRPNEAISGQEAAVILQNMLNLPITASVTNTTMPFWSARSVMALTEAGILTDFTAEQLTFNEVATLLYQVHFI